MFYAFSVFFLVSCEGFLLYSGVQSCWNFSVHAIWPVFQFSRMSLNFLVCYLSHFLFSRFIVDTSYLKYLFSHFKFTLKSKRPLWFTVLFWTSALMLVFFNILMYIIGLSWCLITPDFFFLGEKTRVTHLFFEAFNILFVNLSFYLI